jgi:site-specific DNA-methyltransferase (adenine-specific)
MYHFLSHLPDLDLPRQTVHRIRKGQGRLVVLVAALRAAGYDLRPDPTTLACTTHSGGDEAGQREIARRAGIARATVAALASGQGTIQSFIVLATALKVTPRIVKRKRYSACMSSRDQTWQTPRDLLDAILVAAGREDFDLDPCSPAGDGPVPALARWTEAHDGLSRPWTGLVFVNPPYSRALPRWVSKCAAEAAEGAVVVGLVPSRTDTRWWHDHVAGQADVIMLKGRLKFGGGAHAAPFPSAIVVWGDSQLAERVAAAISGSWLILSQKTAA